MAELSLKQVEDKLNEEFTGDSRKIVFWYDEKKEFTSDLSTIKLENAIIHYLNTNNSFATKVLLERDDLENNYLIYAPFKKPDSRENHLADTIKYSREFFADRITLISADLGIDERYKKLLKKHKNFFDAKDRTQRFYDIEVDFYNEDTIEIALLSALAKSRILSLEEVVRIILTNDELNNNKYLLDSKKYGLDQVFWDHIGKTFSFIDDHPNLEKFIISLFLTYTDKEIQGELPEYLHKYILSKSGTIMTFMDQIMNNILYRDEFARLSSYVFSQLKGKAWINDYPIEAVIDLDIFEYIDEKIIHWIIDRLVDENLNASVNKMNIPAICEYREEKHFGNHYSNEYHALKHSFYIISQTKYKAENNLLDMIDRYVKEDYKIDSHYRKFYYYLDRCKNPHIFDNLKDLVENIYTNRYLDEITREFNNKFSYDGVKGKHKLQRNFYKNYVEDSREMLVVIISDGLRYEVAKDLVKNMERNKKYSKVEISPQIGILPSYTRLGMAALLPHKELTIDDDYNVFVDGLPCTNLVERDKILKSHREDSASIQYSDIKKMKKEELRKFFVGKSLVYIYHNQIDKRGETAEDEVFTACKEAIDEIDNLIVRLTDSTSRVNYIVTADHGFIYKRSKLVESDKIEKFSYKDDMVNKRFVLSDKDFQVLGTKSLMVADAFGNQDDRTITMPMASNIFKTVGGGQNYVHGGSSPQEILIPVIGLKTIRGFRESKNAEITLISALSSINNLIINLDFFQQEPISDVVKPTRYRISFVDDGGDAISNQETYLANSKEKESQKRIFKLRFNLKNQRYSRDEKYYLLAYDEETGMEAFSHRITIDIAFSDDFGFDL